MKKTLTIEEVDENGNLPAGWRDKEKVNPTANSIKDQWFEEAVAGANLAQ